MIPASEFISHAFEYAKLRRFLAPLNINSTLSHLLDDGVVIFFIIVFYSIRLLITDMLSAGVLTIFRNFKGLFTNFNILR